MKYIYHLLDPRSKIVRYIGATSRPKMRLNQHIKDALKPKIKPKTKKQKWILELLENNMSPEIKIIGSEGDLSKARIVEEKEVMKHIDTIYNIHMPGKRHGLVIEYKKNGTLKAKNEYRKRMEGDA